MSCARWILALASPIEHRCCNACSPRSSCSTQEQSNSAWRCSSCSAVQASVSTRDAPSQRCMQTRTDMHRKQVCMHRNPQTKKASTKKICTGTDATRQFHGATHRAFARNRWWAAGLSSSPPGHHTHARPQQLHLGAQRQINGNGWQRKAKQHTQRKAAKQARKECEHTLRCAAVFRAASALLCLPAAVDSAPTTPRDMPAGQHPKSMGTLLPFAAKARALRPRCRCHCV